VIFVDSSFWIAMRNVRDPRHPEAQQLLREAAKSKLVTTSLVRGETWTYLRRKLGHAVALSFLNSVERSPRLRIEFVPQTIERQALLWLRRHDERDYSFVDATSFAVMKSLKIRQALAFDADFSAAGFTELRA
jgi:predicted nucleic acid-binding protein